MKYDLHVHSTFSDGSFAPAELAEEAARRHLSGFALTDHDAVEGIAPASKRAAELGVNVLPGVEISVIENDGALQLHLLAYEFDAAHAELCDALAGTRERRQERADQIARQLRETGIDFDLERARELAGTGSLGRPHLARVLVESGVCRDTEDAFTRFLRRGRPGFVPSPGLAAREAIDLVHRAGGCTSLAHPPLSSGIDAAGGIEPFIAGLAELGLDGVEVAHPRHKRKTRKQLRRIARDRGLMTTGGSDFHGASKPGIRLGQERVEFTPR